MKIEKIENETKKINFENLKVGDCYLDSVNRLCMKIESFFNENGCEYDCICLEDGVLNSDWGEVTLIEVTLQYYIK